MLKKFDWFYIGAEFCENLLTVEFCGEAAALQAAGKKVCLLTPPVSGGGIKTLDAVFRKLLSLYRRGRLDPDRLEITVNDFGALELAVKRRLPFRLNSGRLLFDNAFEGSRNFLRIHSFGAIELFARFGVKRHELSDAGGRRNYTLRGPGGTRAAELKISLFYPYLNLTSARACPVGMPEARSAEQACGRACLAASFELDHPAIKEKLSLRGNTVFLELPRRFPAGKKELSELRVDRLVYCPFP